MKTMIAIVLIVIGILGLAYKEVSYTTEEEFLEIGPVEATRDKTETIPISPIVSGAALVGGAVLLVINRKK